MTPSARSLARVDQWCRVALWMALGGVWALFVANSFPHAAWVVLFVLCAAGSWGRLYVSHAARGLPPGPDLSARGGSPGAE